MQTKNQARLNILELCSESEYGSWEFWSTKDNKTNEECKNIIEAISELVSEKKIFAMEGSSVDDHSYKETIFNTDRLSEEVEQSMQPYNVDPHTFYWFAATEEGRKEDLLSRKE